MGENDEQIDLPKLAKRILHDCVTGTNMHFWL